VTRFLVRNDGIRSRPFDPKQFTIDKGQWIVHGDELMQTDGRFPWPCLMFGDNQWTDYDFTVDLMRLHGIEAVYLVVRGADKDNNLVFTNSGWGGTRSLIEVIEKGNCRARRDVGCRFENLKWYTARVRVRGSEVVGTLLDGAKEIARVEVNDNRHPRGRVGLRTWYSAYRFKNIRVTAPDGKTLWEGPPAIESPRPAGPPAPKNPYPEGWVSLFNGKDLSGWTAFRGDDEIAPEEIFFVDRSELACFPGNWGRLSTQAAYSNFVLSLDFHIGPGEDAGLVFQTVPAQGVERKHFVCHIFGEQPNDAYGCGDIIDSDNGLLGRPQAPSQDGGFFGRTRRADLTDGGWNSYEIRNEGQNFTVRLNGVVVNEVSSTWEGPWRVGLQARARGSARFCNIAIKGLDGKPPTIVSPAPVVADERPVPPVMDLAVKKQYCDLIDVNSEYRFQLDQLRNGSLQYAEYNWRFYESNSRFFARDAFGRNDVLLTHPFGGDRPATIDFTRITKDRAGELVLVVHSFPDAANDGSRIVVKVNNKEVHRSRIRFADGWKAIAVPFDRSTVVVEHFPIGWNWEYAFIDFVVKEQSDLRASDKPNRVGLSSAGGRESQKVSGNVDSTEIFTRQLIAESATPSTATKSSARRAGSRKPADAREFQGKFYKLYPQQLSWHEARERCRQMSGHLAVVVSQEENNFLVAQMRARNLDSAWLGATDEQHEGKWLWVDGTPMRYSNWSPVGNQPNNKQGLEHYLLLWLAHDGKWSDQPNIPVELRPGFVCQWD